MSPRRVRYAVAPYGHKQAPARGVARFTRFNMAGFPKGKARKGESPVSQPHLPLIKDDILRLIKEEHGNLSRVADRMGCTRHAVRNRCDKDEDLKQALEDARERRIDQLERSCWDDAIEHHDTALRCFLLKTQARHRGYDQDEAKNAAKDIATAAFDFIVSKTKQSTT